jgi:hypothetical protein
MTNNTIIKLLNYTINGCAVTGTCGFFIIYYVYNANNSQLLECAVALGPGGVSCVKAISKKGHGMRRLFQFTVPYD